MGKEEIIKIFEEKALNYKYKMERLQMSINLYEEIINNLESGKISKEAKKFLKEKYGIELNKYNYNNYLPSIKADLFIAKELLSIHLLKYKNCCLIKKALKYRQILPKNLFEFIKEELTTDKRREKDIIKIFEQIKLHNRMHTVGVKNSLKGNELFLILKLLDHGFELLPPLKPLENHENLTEKAKKFIELYKANDFETSEDVMDNELSYLNKEEQEYIYLYMLRHYQNLIYELIDVLKNTEFYFDVNLLEELKNEYKELMSRYIFIRDKLDILKQKEVTYAPLNLTEPVIEESFEDTNKLYYATNSEDPARCSFIMDLTKLNYEGLESIQKLIDDFKKGSMRNYKQLKSATSSFGELKSDQIRIVLKALGNNQYAVLGVFIKKSQNSNMYDSMVKRPEAYINDDYSEMVENIYREYIKTYGRKSSR